MVSGETLRRGGKFGGAGARDVGGENWNSAH
jgi:hypothetical protein